NARRSSVCALLFFLGKMRYLATAARQNLSIPFLPGSCLTARQLLPASHGFPAGKRAALVRLRSSLLPRQNALSRNRRSARSPVAALPTSCLTARQLLPASHCFPVDKHAVLFKILRPPARTLCAAHRRIRSEMPCAAAQMPQ
ncbi:MAG: hypothetical protein ACI4I8_05310, partial [Oscillospiraceae bacterium]